MPDDRRPITFVVAGRRRDASRTDIAAPVDPLLGGRVKASVRLATSRGASVERITAMPGEDVVVLRLPNGPALYLHPEVARDLIRAQAGAANASRSPSLANAETERWRCTPS